MMPRGLTDVLGRDRTDKLMKMTKRGGCGYGAFVSTLPNDPGFIIINWLIFPTTFRLAPLGCPFSIHTF